MYGAAMGTLNLHLITSTMDTILWTMSGDQGNQWLNQIVDLSGFSGNVVKLSFEGTTGAATTSDMALDDIDLYDFSLPPAAGFTSNISSTCTIIPIQFSDASTNAPSSWNWSFNPSTISYLNGTTDTSQNPLVLFNATGTYDVQLIASNANGSDTLIQNGYISIVNGTLIPITQDFDTFALCGTTTNCGAEMCPLGFGWRNQTNGSEDNIDWRVFNASTPSANTGPDFDHTTGAGNYVYIEASNCYVNTGRLASDCIDLTNNLYPKLSFWHHIYGNDMGTLNVVVNHASGQDTIWSISGDQGNQWEGDTVDLVAYSGQTISIIFEGTTLGTGGNLGDMAIDDIDVFNQQLPPSNAFSASALSVCTGTSVLFTDQTQFSPVTWDWSFNPGSITYINGTSSSSQNPEVLFNTVGQYSVTLETSNGGGTDSLTITNMITVSDAISIPIVNDFELDSTVSTATNCGGQISPLINGWINELNGASDNIDWRVNAGSTPTITSGPDVDHTTDDTTGHYVYLEASQCFGQTALLTSPCIDFTGFINPTLTFYYHMLGASMGELHVDVITEDSIDYDVASPLIGEVDSFWHEQVVDLNAFAGQVIKIRFRGITGANAFSDMAIDDINIDVLAAPNAAFNFNPDPACVGQNVVFTSTSSGGITGYDWDFGSGANPATANTQGPHTVTYSSTGSVTATLTVTNAAGSDIQTMTITVDDDPTSNFSASINLGDADFTNSSTNGNSYLWDFGDGSTSSQMNPPTHTYAAGNYTVTLTVTNDCGTDVTTQNISISVGIENLNNDYSFQINPNPGDGLFNLSVTKSIQGNIKIEVFDVNGKLILENEINSMNRNDFVQINLTSLPKGIYHLKIQTPDNVVMKKLVLQ